MYFLAFILLTGLLHRFIKWLSPRLPLIYVVLRHGGLPPPAVPLLDPTSKEANVLPAAGAAHGEIPPGSAPAPAGVSREVPAGVTQEAHTGAADGTTAAGAAPTSAPTGAPVKVRATTVMVPTQHNGDAHTEANPGVSGTLAPRDTRTDVLGDADRSPPDARTRCEELPDADTQSPPPILQNTHMEEQAEQGLTSSPHLDPALRQHTNLLHQAPLCLPVEETSASMKKRKSSPILNHA
jgi:hypothetical protein